jgi:hypothetical protein
MSKHETPQAHTTTTRTVSASGPGGVGGTEITCTCGLVWTVSLAGMAATEASAHLAWHGRTPDRRRHRPGPTLTLRADGTMECSAGCPLVILPENAEYHLDWHTQEESATAAPSSEPETTPAFDPYDVATYAGRRFTFVDHANASFFGMGPWRLADGETGKSPAGLAIALTFVPVADRFAYSQWVVVWPADVRATFAIDEEETMRSDHCHADDRGETCFGADENCHPQEETMRSEETTTKASPTDAGCWIDGHWGQYSVARMVDIAMAHGYRDEEVTGLAARMLAHMGPNMGRTDIADLTDDEHESLSWAADEVEQWLNDNVAPEGYSFGWHDGEFFLQPEQWWEEEEVY